MKLTRKVTDRIIQGIALLLLLGITFAFIGAVSGGKLTFLTQKEDYKTVYAYTESGFEGEFAEE